jgi:hypothetical protein
MCSILGFWFLSRPLDLECCVIRHAGLAESALIIMNAKAATNIPKPEAKLHG